MVIALQIMYYFPTLIKCDIKKYFLYFDIILFNIYFIFYLILNYLNIVHE